MKLYSKMLDSKNFNLNTFFNIKGKIKNIYISSAYCDIESINKIIMITKNKLTVHNVSFKIFIDKNANKALPTQSKYDFFCKVDKKLKKISNNSGIFLFSNNGNLFHSKIYYIESSLQKKAYIGSMNLTQKAIHSPGNEEILIEITNTATLTEINNYFFYLENNSINIAQVSSQKNNYTSLRNFFLQGNIYIPYTKSEFFNFKVGIPKNIKIYNKNVPLPSNISDNINILDMLFPELKDKKSKLSWKNYTIETPYGYWAPAESKKIITHIINNKKEIQNEIIQVAKTLSNKQEINKMMEDQLKKVNNWLINSFTKQELEDWSIQKAKNKWNKWYNNLLNKLNLNNTDEIDKDNLQIQRYITGVHITVLPDIWYDSFLSEDFEICFMESLLIEINKTKTKNKFANFIKEKIDNQFSFDIIQFKKIILNKNYSEQLKTYNNNLLNMIKK